MSRRAFHFASLAAALWLAAAANVQGQVTGAGAYYNPYTGASAAARARYNPYTGRSTYSAAYRRR